MFLKDISNAEEGCIYLIKKYSKNSNIVKYYNLKYFFYVNIFKTAFIPVMKKLNFQQPFL